jgi:hypothetical protein
MYQQHALVDLARVRPRWQRTTASSGTPYESAFLHWDDRASVRRKSRRLLEEPPDDALYFPPALFPAVSHPLVLAKGPEVMRQLLVRHLYDYLNFTTELEALAVIPIAGQISRGNTGIELPEQMRVDAFKIVTDEAWHAQFSDDFAQQVEARTEVPRNRPRPPAFVGRLSAIRDRLPSAVRGLESLLFTIVSETLVSNILADVPRDNNVQETVRAVVRDHAEDEGRHHVYFRTLLRYLWSALDQTERRAVGPVLPRIIFAFLEPDYGQIGDALGACGLTADEVEQVLVESWPAERLVRDAGNAGDATVRYFSEVGAFDEPGTAAAFEASGLVDGLRSR